MKHILTIILFLSITFPSIAQISTDSTLTLQELNRRFDEMQYNLDRYQGVRSAGYTLSITSSLISGIGIGLAFTPGQESLSNTLLIAGGLLSITSFFTFWSAEKHLKRASIKLIPGGVAIPIRPEAVWFPSFRKK